MNLPEEEKRTESEPPRIQDELEQEEPETEAGQAPEAQENDDSASDDAAADENIPPDTEEEDEDEDEDDWENRILCSDGNCIGVIGPDGRCKECGKPYEGGEDLGFDDDEGFDPNQDDDDEGFDPYEDDDKGFDPYEVEVESEAGEFSESGSADAADDFALDPDEPEVSESGGADDDWENRKLCSDGNCIGVIGPDGRCKECGKPYQE